jgi:hypothetical protein
MKKQILTLLILFISIIGFGQQECPGHIPEFTVNITKPVILNQVIFSAGSCDPDGSPMSWSINGVTNNSVFPYKLVTDPNDSSRIIVKVNNVTYVHETPENFTFTITLTDSAGNFNESKIYVININHPPVVVDQTF